MIQITRVFGVYKIDREKQPTCAPLPCKSRVHQSNHWYCQQCYGVWFVEKCQSYVVYTFFVNNSKMFLFFVEKVIIAAGHCVRLDWRVTHKGNNSLSVNIVRFLTWVIYVNKLEPDLSDHCQLSCLLKCNFYESFNDSKKILMPDKFIWNDKSQLLFEAALNSHQRRSCIYAVTPWRAHRQVKKIKNK